MRIDLKHLTQVLPDLRLTVDDIFPELDFARP